MQLAPPKGTGNGYPTFKFTEVGDAIAGEITSEPDKVNTPSLNDKSVLIENLVFEVRTDDGEDFTVWVQTNKQMYRALYDAVTASGGKLSVGGRIGIKFARTEPSKYPQPTKIYDVAYKAPAATASAGRSVEDLI